MAHFFVTFILIGIDAEFAIKSILLREKSVDH